MKNKLNNANEIEDVIFRKYSNGEIIAIFPAFFTDEREAHVQSYMRTDGFGACNPMFVYKQNQRMKMNTLICWQNSKNVAI